MYIYIGITIDKLTRSVHSTGMCVMNAIQFLPI